MPTARELLEQADALMRRNRSTVSDDIPVLTEAVSPRPTLRVPLRPSPESAPQRAEPAVEVIPTLTEKVPATETPAAGAIIAEGEPSDWLDLDEGEPSVTGRAPDSIVEVPDVLLGATTVEEADNTPPSESAEVELMPAAEAAFDEEFEEPAPAPNVETESVEEVRATADALASAWLDAELAAEPPIAGIAAEAPASGMRDSVTGSREPMVDRHEVVAEPDAGTAGRDDVPAVRPDAVLDAHAPVGEAHREDIEPPPPIAERREAIAESHDAIAAPNDAIAEARVASTEEHETSAEPRDASTESRAATREPMPPEPGDARLRPYALPDTELPPELTPLPAMAAETEIVFESPTSVSWNVDAALTAPAPDAQHDEVIELVARDDRAAESMRDEERVDTSADAGADPARGFDADVVPAFADIAPVPAPASLVPSPAEALMPLMAPSVPVAAPAPDDARWAAMAEEIRMQVLQRIDIFTDTGLREQLGRRLQPIVDRASADLVATINQHVGELLRAYVAEAIEREIDNWRKGI